MQKPPLCRALFGIVVAAPAWAATGLELASAGARVTFDQPEGEIAANGEEPPPPPLPLESETSFLKGWTGSVEFGLNGSTGNTEELDVLGRFDARRDTDRYLTRVTASFEYGTAEGEETDNEFTIDARNSWKLRDPRWRIFLQGGYEYNEFEDWLHRFTLGPGVEYQAINNDRTELLLRAGVQARKEVGGEDNTWSLEGVIGFDATHKLTERQTLEAGFDFYPQLDDIGPYRFEADLAWRIEVDPAANLFLRTGIHSEYDSTPGPDRKRHDLDYYLTLGWAF